MMRAITPCLGVWLADTNLGLHYLLEFGISLSFMIISAVRSNMDAFSDNLMGVHLCAACVLTLKWKRPSELSRAGLQITYNQESGPHPQVFLVHVFSSCFHVLVLLVLRFHCLLGMSRDCLASHLKIPETFCKV